LPGKHQHFNSLLQTNSEMMLAVTIIMWLRCGVPLCDTLRHAPADISHQPGVAGAIGFFPPGFCSNTSLYPSIYLWLYSPLVGPWPLLQFLTLYIVGRSPWTGDQPVAMPLLTHRINAQKHPCLEWDSNPRSQYSSGRRQFMF
jgi:hypothetical protein